MTITRGVSVLVLVSMLVIAGGVAIAEPPPGPAAEAPPAEATATDAAPARPTDRRTRSQAAAEMKRGMKLIAAQQYDEAIAAISTAHSLDPKTEHLYNLGVAHHLKGDSRGALEWYRKFLASGPRNRQLVKAAERFAAELTRAIEAEDAARARDEAAAKAAKDAADAEAERARVAQEDAARKAREEAARRAERERLERERALASGLVATGGGRVKRALGTSLLVVGGAAIGAGIVAALEARSAHDELDGLEEGDRWTVSRDWLVDRGESAERRAILLSSIGAGVAIGGAVLYYLGERDARGPEAPIEQRRPVVTPAVTAGGASLTIAGSF